MSSELKTVCSKWLYLVTVKKSISKWKVSSKWRVQDYDQHATPHTKDENLPMFEDDICKVEDITEYFLVYPYTSTRQQVLVVHIFSILLLKIGPCFMRGCTQSFSRVMIM